MVRPLRMMLFDREEEHTWHLELKLWYVKYRFHCVAIPDPIKGSIDVNIRVLKRNLNLLILIIFLAIIFGALSSASGRSACHPQPQ